MGGANHVLIDIPLGPSAKVRTLAEAEQLGGLFDAVSDQIDLRVDVEITDAHAPIGRGIGPRLEALDVLAVLRDPTSPAAPVSCSSASSAQRTAASAVA
jgi:thymidine phosphorylase